MVAGELPLLQVWYQRLQIQQHNKTQGAHDHSALARSNSECSICLELWQQPLVLGCSHIFCAACLSSVRDNTCPLCRTCVTSYKTWTTTMDDHKNHISSSSGSSSCFIPCYQRQKQIKL